MMVSLSKPFHSLWSIESYSSVDVLHNQQVISQLRSKYIYSETIKIVSIGNSSLSSCFIHKYFKFQILASSTSGSQFFQSKIMQSNYHLFLHLHFTFNCSFLSISITHCFSWVTLYKGTHNTSNWDLKLD